MRRGKEVRVWWISMTSGKEREGVCVRLVCFSCMIVSSGKGTVAV